MAKPPVLIFRDKLLGASETFISAAAESLNEFEAYYVGSRLVPGISLPQDRTIILNRRGSSGRLLEIPFKVFGLPCQFTRRINKLRPSLIHAHFGTDGALALPLSRSLRIPMIVTFHGFDATVRDEYGRSRALRLYRRRRPQLQKEGTRFIAVSEFIKGKMLEQGYPAHKTIVHYIGIDVDQFRPTTVSREPIVLFVGRLVEKKGCEHVIRAMALLQADIPEAELVIIGDGELRSRLESLARTTAVRHRFLGVQPPAVVREWMNRSKVFCVPSITASSGDAEGFGMVFAEAQAMGLPVVSYASGGIPEAVGHGESGLLAPEGDEQMLAAYLAELLRNEETWGAFSSRGRHRVERCFDLKRQTYILEQIYQDVIRSWHREHNHVAHARNPSPR